MSMPTTTTVERKCGAYVTVCTNFLNLSEPASFSRRASRIGIGKPTASR